MEIDSLSKKAVGDLIQETNGEVEELLKLRLLMAKTSVKKYEAMERCVCTDGRVHGLLQFYGANRTGRWCLTGDHEVLTFDGWKRLDEWKGGEYFDTETLEARRTEMYMDGYKAGLVKDTSYKGLWKVSFTLKEF